MLRPLLGLVWTIASLVGGLAEVRGESPPRGRHVLILHSFERGNGYTQAQERTVIEALDEPAFIRAGVDIEYLDAEASTGDNYVAQFAGERASSVPPAQRTAITAMFDWDVLRRCGVRGLALRSETVICGMPVSSLWRYKWYVAGGGALLLIHSLILAAFLAGRARNRRAEQQIRASEERYRTLVEMSPDAVIYYSPVAVEYVNPAGVRLFGARDASEVVGRSPLEFFDHESHPVVEARVGRLLKGETLDSVAEVRVRRCDGSLVDAEAACCALHDGRDTRLQTILREVTARKQAERSLRESEERYRNLVELSPDAIVAHRDDRIVYANSAAARLLAAKSVDELVGRAAMDFAHPADREVTDARARFLHERGGTTPPLERRLLRLDGTEVVAEVTATAAKTGDGVLIQAIARDITQRKQAEKALYESEARYRKLVEFSPDAIIIHRDGKFVYANPACLELLGARSADEVIGKPAIEIIPEKDRPLILNARKQVRETGKATGLMEHGVVRLDGNERFVEGIGTLVDEADGVTFQVILRDITSRKRAEAALRDSEARFRAVFQQASVGIARVGPKGEFLEVNDSICRILGRSREDLMARTFMEVTHPDDLGMHLDLSRKALAGEVDVYAMDKRYVRPDGSVVWAELSTAVVRNANHEIEQQISVVQDISDRKRAEESMRKISAFREAVIRTTAEGICVCHAITESPFVRFSVWNDQMTELTGYTLEEINRIGWYQAVYPDPIVQARARERMDRMRQGDDLKREEWTITRRDGASRIVAISTSVVDGDDGQPAVVASMQDVTDRRRAEENLRRSELHYRMLTESMEDEISLHDHMGRFVYVSPSAERNSGYAPDELLTRDIGDLAHPDDRDAVRAAINALNVGKGSTEVEWRRRHRSGSIGWVQTRMNLLQGDVGAAGSLVCCTRDIGARKRAEERVADYTRRLEVLNRALAEQKIQVEAFNNELRTLAKSLEEANVAACAASQAKSDFLANMSHEIRTPMTAIVGFAERLLDAAISDSERLDAVLTIRRNGDHLLHILNEVLDLSKIEAGRMTVELAPCPLLRLINDVQTLLRPRAEAKGLAFEVEAATAVPESLLTDTTRLRQILLNLVGNSIKFTDAGKVRLVVSLPSAAAKLLQFDVIDTGIGIAQDQIGLLFESFSQVDASAARRFGGTGLGLAISKKLAKLLGGDVVVHESKLGEGTTMRATIATGSLDEIRMVMPSGELQRPSATYREIESVSRKPLEAMRVLLVEDGPDNRRLITYILRQFGALVDVADDGRAGVVKTLAAVESGAPYDVILMDMQMPEMDGYEATTFLRQQAYRGPIVALTAHVMVGDRHRCIEAGCDEYATKPIDRRALCEVLLRMTGRQSDSLGGQSEFSGVDWNNWLGGL